MIDLQTKLVGEYRLVVNRADGTVKDSGWFSNLILNQGLDFLGSSSLGPLRYAHVGTGTSTPVVTQTALDSFLASAQALNSSAANSVVNEGASLYRCTLTYSYAFAQGAVVGNVTEIGVGTTSTSGNLFSRARIVDNLGNPTSISVVALDQLTVYYRVRLAPPLTDATGTVTISGTSYGYTMRVASVASFAQATSLIQSNAFSAANTVTAFQAGSVLGAITGSPTSTSSGGTVTTSAYTVGTYYRDSTLNWSISQGNLSGGIQCLTVSFGSGVMSFQTRFDTVIPKTNTNVLALNIRFSWARG